MKQLYPAKIRFDRTDNAYPNGVYLVEFQISKYAIPSELP